MQRSHIATSVVHSLALLCLPLTLLASEPVIRVGQSSPTVSAQPWDCQLDANHGVIGRLVNRHGLPVANCQLVLSPVAGADQRTRSDENGRFRFREARPGVVALAVGRESQVVRIWDARLAPPSAKPELMFVVGDVVRAQCCNLGANCSGCDTCGSYGYQGHFGGVFQRMLQNPWLIGAGTAAAIAIPLGTDDDDDLNKQRTTTGLSLDDNTDAS